MFTNEVKAAAPKKVSVSRQAFSKALIDLRKKLGYATAYGFFHKNGGHKHFGFSYTHYLRVEAGDRLPSEKSLEAILKVITMPQLEQGKQELTLLFVKALLGENPIFSQVFKSENMASTEMAAGA